MKRLIPILLLLTASTFVLNLVADRLTPYTDNARVKAITIPITPQVNGYISSVAVTNYQSVEKGATLVQIDATPYKLKVDASQAALEQAIQLVGTNVADVEIARSDLAKAQILKSNVSLNYNRVRELKQRGLVAQSRVDDAFTDLEEANQNLELKRAALDKSERALGNNGTENATIKRAISALELAKLEYQWTTIKAPQNGVVVDLTISSGTYAQDEKPLMTFISSDDVWIDAFYTENNLGNIKLGDEVSVVLDAHPGQVFKGYVSSLNPGANASLFNFGNSDSQLPTTPRMSGWMREPQRFPVRIRLAEHTAFKDNSDILFRFNGQADVVIYSQESNGLMNYLAKLWIHFLSYVSYAY